MRCPDKKLTNNSSYISSFWNMLKKTGFYQPDDQQWDEVCSECLDNQNTNTVASPIYLLSHLHKLLQQVLFLGLLIQMKKGLLNYSQLLILLRYDVDNLRPFNVFIVYSENGIIILSISITIIILNVVFIFSYLIQTVYITDLPQFS